MVQLTDIHFEDFTASTSSGFGRTHHSGLHAQDCPADWAAGSDEAGNLLYCEAAIVDYLQRDAA